MKFLDRMERKLGKYAIRNLMMYIVVGKIAVYFLCLFNTNFVFYLTLTPSFILRGQVWRLVTFLFIPYSIYADQLLWVAISLYFDYFIGKMLENRWGAFRFNVYYFIGVLFTIAASFLCRKTGSDEYLNESLFLAFAALFPEIQVLLFFFIPIKVRWMGWAMGAMLLIQFIQGPLSVKVMIAASLANFLIFFGAQLLERIRYAIRRKNWQQKANPQNQTARTQWTAPRAAGSGGKVITNAAFHRCTICGKTEQDDPSMQFRYCAECDGAREYCMDHLYNHTHYRAPQNSNH